MGSPTRSVFALKSGIAPSDRHNINKEGFDSTERIREWSAALSAQQPDTTGEVQAGREHLQH